jgi:DNA mismatch repair protein MutS
VFLHQVKSGPANRSYGLQVAALAGLPPAVVDKARGYLQQLEAQPTTRAAAATPKPQMSLFEPEAPPELVALLKELDPDQLTPRQALDSLYRLRALLSKP